MYTIIHISFKDLQWKHQRHFFCKMSMRVIKGLTISFVTFITILDKSRNSNYDIYKGDMTDREDNLTDFEILRNFRHTVVQVSRILDIWSVEKPVAILVLQSSAC